MKPYRVIMKLEDVKFDCKHFRGAIPCKPNKILGVTCDHCSEYLPASKRILIIKLGALGDVIRTTPLMVRLKQEYPDCHITWLTLSPDILPKNEIDELYKLDAVSLYTIANSDYDIAINLDKDPEACMLLAEVNAAEKYGFTWNNNHIDAATPAAVHKLMTGFFDNLSQQNTKSYLEEIFEICHLDFRLEPYQINLDEGLSEQWRKKIRTLADGRTVVGLNTGCGPRWNTRLWSEESWISLAVQLREAGFYPVFLGGQLEHEKNLRMSREAAIHYPGHFSLQEFIALTNACDVIVTQVSMMMHIATALQKQMVLMNNIFNPYEFELYGRGVIVGPPEPCICYYGNSCKRGRSCMHDITSETVFENVVRLNRPES